MSKGRTTIWGQFGTINNTIEIVPYTIKWVDAFEYESKRIRNACHNTPVKIEHIGSTSIPGLSAKPVLDIMIGFFAKADGENLIEPMQELKYEYHGEYGITGRYFFVLKHQNRSVVHVHCFVVYSEDWNRHMFFKNYLLNNSEQMKNYEALKVQLAQEYKTDRKSYSNGKSEFIKSIENLRHDHQIQQTPQIGATD